MCNQYANTLSYSDYSEGLPKFGLRLVSPKPKDTPNLEPRLSIRPTDKAPIIRAANGGVELKEVRWGLVPHFYKGPLKSWKVLGTNARIETVSQAVTFRRAFRTRRCLVPATHFYEWTGERKNKTKWFFQDIDKPWFMMAGLWDRAETVEGAIESFTVLTMPAGPDVAPYHARQPVVLLPQHCADWLDPAIDVNQVVIPPHPEAFVARQVVMEEAA